jgi:Ser/Thr protein kinase RdoA (MazF antagonist)
VPKFHSSGQKLLTTKKHEQKQCHHIGDTAGLLACHPSDVANGQKSLRKHHYFGRLGSRTPRKLVVHDQTLAVSIAHTLDQEHDKDVRIMFTKKTLGPPNSDVVHRRRQGGHAFGCSM